MADITLNVEVREKSGTGGARAARRDGKVPGILYGGGKDPVAIAVAENAFKKALYTGKLLGHLVKLQHGSEVQSVIAKDVQFDPVSDKPLHFDLYRVEENQRIKINVAVRFEHEEESPGLKRGGALNVVRHEIELWAPANAIPDVLTADLTGLEIGDQVRMSSIALPNGVEPTVTERDFVIATVTTSSSMAAADEAADTASAEAAAAETTEAAAETTES